MSAEGSFLAMVLAVLVDTWGIGGPRFQPFFDRLACLGWIAAFKIGLDGTGVTGQISGLITAGFKMIAGIFPWPIWKGGVAIGPQLIGVIIAAIMVGAMAPQKWLFLGRLSQIQFAHLRQAGGSAMASTGIARGGPSGPPPAAKGNGWFRKLFPGSVNVGLVALCLLFVTFATTVHGGIGTFMQQCVMGAVNIMSALMNPLLGSIGAATNPGSGSW